MVRLWAGVKKGEGCWEWQGAVNTAGYGGIGDRGKTLYVHRLVYAATVGPIPEKYDVMHSCDNRLCVRPDHLTVGTRRENMLDASRKGRMNRPTCKNGHRWTERNAMRYRQKDGLVRRRCRICYIRSRQKYSSGVKT
jgi:hypothetical protein